MARTIIKEEVISEVCNDTAYSRGIVTSVLNSLLANITLELSKGNRVQFAGFGTFELKERAARTGRNPHTGEAVPIPARVIPSFEAGERLKRAAIQNK
jgi:DNA-binding protein HU-beta